MGIPTSNACIPAASTAVPTSNAKVPPASTSIPAANTAERIAALPQLLMMSQIVAGSNDRTVFKSEELRSLADSIAEHGLLQPISVRHLPDSEIFQIIAGERRFRAIQLLNWEQVPAMVLEVSDEEASALMLAENTARADLDPMDEAKAYQTRMRLFGWNEEECGKRAGVSGSRVRSRLKLLRLNSTLQTLARSQQLPHTYAQTVADAGLDDIRQLKAVEYLNKNAKPSIEWFKGLVSELLEKQLQGNMFDDFDFVPSCVRESSALEEKLDPKKLTRPLKHTPPPKPEGDPRTDLEFQRDYWRDMQSKWTRVKSYWFAQECEMAVKVLETAIATTQKVGA
jgi:ParB/RepB/Spo0J family partition protein